ncbi:MULTISPECIES: hypothetical protein [unclassified Methanoculleus]|uniref:Uncharacterized protein n=1 Tax=Methanoculleus palmolei TaxID=72612 RepID=A0ABD8A9B7_9EURY|nr:hypothetical protein R6Y95_09265 [Methanoculleus palmolei]
MTGRVTAHPAAPALQQQHVPPCAVFHPVQACAAADDAKVVLLMRQNRIWTASQHSHDGASDSNVALPVAIPSPIPAEREVSST